MKTNTRIIAITLAASAMLCAQSGQKGTLHVLASNGVREAVDELRPELEKISGRSIAFDYGTSASLRQRIESGDAFDVAILTTELIATLIDHKKLAADARVDVGKCGIGFAVKAGAPKPDIGTPAAIKAALLHAKSVTYARDGASRTHIEGMFDKLGITSNMTPKLQLEAGSVASAARVANGQSEVLMTLVSEILPIKGVQLVGPLPKELQFYVSFAASTNPKSSDLKAAQAVVRFLGGPGIAGALKKSGFERP